MKIFISWSGERSKIVASYLRQWIKDIIPSIAPWMSETDINAGTRWSHEIEHHLADTEFGIICLTKNNINAPWLLFEVGALAKNCDNSFVCPYLIDLSPSEIPIGPLSQFQAKKANKDKTLELMFTINNALKDNALSEDQLKRTFERAWSDLNDVLNNLPPENETENEISRLQELDKEIEETGGVSQCPINLIVEAKKLRVEIFNKEKKSSKEQQPRFSISSKYDIPPPEQFIERPTEQQLVEEPLKSTEKWVRNIVIHGIEGAGKTALAIKSARAVEGLFEKVIWISADDSLITFDNILDIILKSVNCHFDTLTLDQKQSKVSKLFSNDPYLLVLDSFERIGDGRVDRYLTEHDFYPSKVLITTRYLWPRANSKIILDGLTLSQTKQMIEEIGESQGIKICLTEDENKTIHRFTGGLPLILTLIINHFCQKKTKDFY